MSEEPQDLEEWEGIAENAWKVSERRDAINQSAEELFHKILRASKSTIVSDEQRQSIQRFLDAYLKGGELPPGIPFHALSLLSGYTWMLAEQAGGPDQSSDILLAAILLAYGAGLNSQVDTP